MMVFPNFPGKKGGRKVCLVKTETNYIIWECHHKTFDVSNGNESVISEFSLAFLHCMEMHGGSWRVVFNSGLGPFTHRPSMIFDGQPTHATLPLSHTCFRCHFVFEFPQLDCHVLDLAGQGSTLPQAGSTNTSRASLLWVAFDASSSAALTMMGRLGRYGSPTASGSRNWGVNCSKVQRVQTCSKLCQNQGRDKSIERQPH